MATSTKFGAFSYTSDYLNFLLKRSLNTKMLIIFQVTKVALTAYTTYKLGTIEMKYRSTTGIGVNVYMNADISAYIYISTSGVVTFLSRSNIAVGTSIATSITYI